ncbi:MAG: hypothetical protein ACTSUD_10220 [Alphaproteobacteria bacterium]
MNTQTPPPAHLGELIEKIRTLPENEAALLISAADIAVDSLKDEVLDILAGDLGRIEILLSAAKNKPRNNAAELRWLYDIVFDAKALAGTFDYPLISHIGESLRCFLKGIAVAGPTKLAVVEHHVQAMSAVIRDGHTGDKSKIGNAVLASLTEVKKIVEDASAGDLSISCMKGVH